MRDKVLLAWLIFTPIGILVFGLLRNFSLVLAFIILWFIGVFWGLYLFEKGMDDWHKEDYTKICGDR